MTPDYLEFKAQVERQRQIIGRKQSLVKKQQDILANLLINCPHEEVEVKNSYFPGSYYDKAYTRYWNQCSLCGVTGPVTVDHHNYYG
jgi:hypothetical protein